MIIPIDKARTLINCQRLQSFRFLLICRPCLARANPSAPATSVAVVPTPRSDAPIQWAPFFHLIPDLTRLRLTVSMLCFGTFDGVQRDAASHRPK